MSNVILIDGGMGQELLKRSKAPPSPLWSAQVLMDEPEIVADVHRAYVDAGASVITLNSYSATPERLGRDAEESLFEPLQRRAIEIAERAREGRSGEVAIAGCLPPLFASYRPDLNEDEAKALATYRRIAAIQGPAVDIVLCETLASVVEIRAATTAARETGKSVWLAMTLKDSADQPSLRSGEPVEAGIAAALECGADAVLANCSWPETISAAFPAFKACGKPWGAYANGFTSIDALLPGGTVSELKARTDLDPAAYSKWALGCVEAGAAIVGGCCEVGPDHIAATREALLDAGHCLVGAL